MTNAVSKVGTPAYDGHNSQNKYRRFRGGTSKDKLQRASTTKCESCWYSNIDLHNNLYHIHNGKDNSVHYVDLHF